MGNVQSAWDSFYNHTAFRNGKYDIDPVGILVVGVHCVLTLLYFLVAWVIKLYRRWRGMDPRAAGMFRLAAARGDLKKMEDLKKGLWHFDVNAKLEDGWTALHAACVTGQPDSVKWLLDNSRRPLRLQGRQLAGHCAALCSRQWQQSLRTAAACGRPEPCCQELCWPPARPLCPAQQSQGRGGPPQPSPGRGHD